MEGFITFPSLIAMSSSILVIFSVGSAKAQVSTPCTASMISTFTPCINFVTGSSSNGASPTAGCCDSVKSLLSNSMDCVCLIVTGNVPFPLPFNQTLAISLPQVCKSSVPIQCQGSSVQLPAPGPVLFGPIVSPLPHIASAPFSPRASKALAAAPLPAKPTLQTAPASPLVHSVAPMATPGIRPVVTPASATNPSCLPSPHLLLMFMGIMAFN
ncbi:hypothetical protein U1Q18_041722 [Sarracenia purpurea var. burkii]